MATKCIRHDESSRRIVLLGKTGVGKSAAGNTIFNEKVFKSNMTLRSITFKCEKKTTNVNDQMVSIVDTPGLFDTYQHNAEVMREIAKCISYLAPGPHVFLVVMRADVRFTEEEQNTVKLIQEMFGKEASRYTMALFTRGDELEFEEKSIEGVMAGDPHFLPFIRQCGGGYHVFNNRSKDPSQVRELLEKINTMVQKNGGDYYTTKMFEEVEKAIEEKKRKYKIAKPNISDGVARAMAEEDNGFIRGVAGIGAVAVGDGARAAAAVPSPVAAVAGLIAVVVKSCSIQ